MIQYLDEFVNTKEKRYHLFIILFLLLCIVTVVPYVTLGKSLICISSYENLYDLLDNPIMRYTYVSRFILLLISSTQFSISHILVCLVLSMRLIEILLLIMAILLYSRWMGKRVTTWILLVGLFEVAFCVFCVVMALRSGTLLDAIYYIRIIGVVLLISSLIMLFIIIIYLFLQYRAYRRALQFTVEEIYD